MKKSKIKVGAAILDKIADSTELTESQKISFLRFVGYLNKREIDELQTLV